MTVVLIDGDGSFNMTLNDLGTVKEHQLPIKIAIMNDHRQQMVHVWQRLFFDNRLMATHVNPDYVALAKSYDIESYCCRHVDELPDIIDKFVNAKGPIPSTSAWCPISACRWSRQVRVWMRCLCRARSRSMRTRRMIRRWRASRRHRELHGS